MALKLKYSDSLFNTGSYSIIHNGDEYLVDPVLFLKYSRKFATLFNFNEKHIEVNDDYDKKSFDLFVEACQCREVPIQGTDAINLLLLAEHWEATTLVTKVEEIIKTTIPAKEILEMYNKFLGTEFPIERLEKIMTACLPSYIKEPLFPQLPFEVIDRIMKGSRAKIGALDIVKLCYAVAEHHKLIAVSVIGNTSFDDLPSDELQELAKLFFECPNEDLSQFFQAMSKLLAQVMSGADSTTQFEVAWRNGEQGNWNQAYDFFQYIRKYQKDQVAQEEGDEAAANLEQSATTTAFLKIAADKGNFKAQYEYSKLLYEKAQTEEDRHVALTYMIQAAAESNSDAVNELKTLLPIPLVPTHMKQYVFATITLQNLLMNLNKRNINNVKSAVFALIFGTERDGINALSSNIMRAVLVRQRSMELYAELVFYLQTVATEENNYGLLKGALFTHIMETMIVEQPGPRQFHLMRFIYICSRIGVYKDDELAESLVTFMNNQKLELSNLIIFYFFAPLLEIKYKQNFDRMVTFMLRLSDGIMGVLNSIFVDFKDNITTLKKNNWELFYKTRAQPAYATDLGKAIAQDDLAAFEKITSQEGFDFNAKIPNDTYDLGIDDTEEITPLQYACIQGSQVIFTFLLQRGYVETHDIHIFSIISAIIGQNYFICNFIVKQLKDKGSLFRLCAEFQNVVLLAEMFKNDFPISEAAEDDGRTALHLAAERGLPDVVKILLSLDGMDLNKKDIDGYTALHIAAANNDIDLVKIITVCRGIILDCRTADNLLPYDLAKSADVKAILKRK
jgi:TPR repeat protein